MHFLVDQRLFITRVVARFKREIIQRIASEKSEISSLTFGPNASETIFERRTLYSKLTVIELQHDRDNAKQGHLFQERSLFDVQNVVLDSSSGILFTYDKKIIEESSSWPPLNLLINSIPKPPRLGLLPKIQEERVIAITSNGFYHWLIEDLAPFIFARNQFPDATILVFESAPFYVKSFVEKYYSNIQYVSRFVRMEQYSFVSKGPDTEWVHPQDISILKEFFAPYVKRMVPGRKIYIPRVNSSRSPEFELALISRLANAGWVIFETQGLLLEEQVEQISSAEVICGVHGAGLAGMVWMAANTTIIELGPKNFVPCFSRLGEVCNLQYFRIPYEVSETMNVNQVFSEIDAIISKSRFTG